MSKCPTLNRSNGNLLGEVNFLGSRSFGTSDPKYSTSVLPSLMAVTNAARATSIASLAGSPSSTGPLNSSCRSSTEPLYS